jgi:hypothetical protein
MKRNPAEDLNQTLQIWQSRQQSDGSLAGVLLVSSAFTVVCFLASPGPGPAFVMGLFLAALAVACARLLNSASMVVRLRGGSAPARLAPEIIEAEVLDVYEAPSGLQFPSGQSTVAFWLPSSAGHGGAFSPAPYLPSRTRRIGWG